MSRLLTFAQNNRKEAERFAKFLVVGAIGFVIDFGTFNLIHVFYSDPATTTDELVAQACSFSAAVVSNFLWNYFWLYPEARTASQRRKMVKFIVVSVAGLFIRTPIIALALPVTQQMATLVDAAHRLPFDLGNNLALATAVVVVLLWNFFANRFWTYSDVR